MRAERFDLELRPRRRGMHLVHGEIEAAAPLAWVEVGTLHLFLRHTSAALFLTERASPEVLTDLARWADAQAPDGWPPFRHTLEGPDDMPAHAKSALFGCELTLPVERGGLVLGTWQGVVLGEFRDQAGPRRVRGTVIGTAREPAGTASS